MKGQGILSSWSEKRLKRNNRRIHGCEKVDKTFWLEVYSYLKESAFAIVRRDAKF